MNKKNERTTATTTDLGNSLNGKMVLHLGFFGKSKEWA